MRMRCSTERDKVSGTNAFGQPIISPIPDRILHQVPCYWQARSETFVADGNKLTAVAMHSMMLPLDEDIKENDTVTEIINRASVKLKDTRLRVVTVIRREAYQSVMLEEYA